VAIIYQRAGGDSCKLPLYDKSCSAIVAPKGGAGLGITTSSARSLTSGGPVWPDVQDFLAYCLDQNRSRKTIDTYRRSCWTSPLALLPRTPVASVGDVTRDHVRDYGRDLACVAAAGAPSSPCAPAPSYLAAIRSWLKYFSVETDTPVLSRDKVFPTPQRRQTPKGVPSAEEVRRLIDETDPKTPWASATAPFLALFFSSGLRIASCARSTGTTSARASWASRRSWSSPSRARGTARVWSSSTTRPPAPLGRLSREKRKDA